MHEIFESKSRQMNSLIQSVKNDHNRLLSKSKSIFYFLKIIVLILCEKTNIQMDLIQSNISSTNQSKKSLKNEANPKFKINNKPSEVLKDSTKNSYFNKYKEESNRNKLNKKNNSLRHSNRRNEQKDISNSNTQNLSLFNYKKSKLISMDKNYCYINNNHINNQNNNINNSFSNIIL